MINQYKRHDVFKCKHDAHKSFNYRVSVYHILYEKKCYPEGCINTVWHCILKERGKRCVKGFNYVGRECKGCTYYRDEKIHLQPELLLDKEEYQHYLNDLEDFEDWLVSSKNKTHNLRGEVISVKPWFQEFILPDQKQRKLRGYLLVLKKNFIGITSFNDILYVRISERMMRRYNFAPQMVIEFLGEINIDRGRILIKRPHSIEIVQNTTEEAWNRDKALVAVRTATKFRQQVDKCLECPWGCLADVKDNREKKNNFYRNIFCLKAISDWRDCYVRCLL
ncbi:MAG: hypothetical protein R6V04_00100 [bacterium]